MIRCECIYKYRNKHGKITRYILRSDNNGVVKEFDSDKLKEEITNGNIEVNNLILTSDNRLIDANLSIKADKDIKLIEHAVNRLVGKLGRNIIHTLIRDEVNEYTRTEIRNLEDEVKEYKGGILKEFKETFNISDMHVTKVITHPMLKEELMHYVHRSNKPAKDIVRGINSIINKINKIEEHYNAYYLQCKKYKDIWKRAFGALASMISKRHNLEIANFRIDDGPHGMVRLTLGYCGDCFSADFFHITSSSIKDNPNNIVTVSKITDKAIVGEIKVDTKNIDIEALYKNVIKLMKGKKANNNKEKQCTEYKNKQISLLSKIGKHLMNEYHNVDYRIIENERNVELKILSNSEYLGIDTYIVSMPLFGENKNKEITLSTLSGKEKAESKVLVGRIERKDTDANTEDSLYYNIIRLLSKK